MRLIDAKGMERGIKEAVKENPFLMGMLLRWVRKQPTIDAVPVVRCKDCALQYGCKVAQRLGNDGFCSYGERKDGDTDGS